jgi:hypothetical protein
VNYEVVHNFHPARNRGISPVDNALIKAREPGLQLGFGFKISMPLL